MFKTKDFVKIKPGKFTMGSPFNEEGRFDNEPQKQVLIKTGFELQVTPVTQHQWSYMMKNNPSYFKGSNLPVEKVSFDDVQVFLKTLNESQKQYIYRLPTEEEWEYACRAGSKKSYCFGDKIKDLTKFAWFHENANRTQPVKKKSPNKWGLHDMHGNVWEWTDSIYGGYNRVVRGGGWGNSARFARSASRGGWSPGGRYDALGFRLVRTKCNSLPSYSLSLEASSTSEAVDVTNLVADLNNIKSQIDELLKKLKRT